MRSFRNDDNYQWFQEKEGETERPIMTNADMGLARDLSAYMNVDEDGNAGAVSCVGELATAEDNEAHAVHCARLKKGNLDERALSEVYVAQRLSSLLLANAVALG